MSRTVARSFFRVLVWNVVGSTLLLGLFFLGLSGLGFLSVIGIAGFFPGLLQVFWILPMLAGLEQRIRRATREGDWAAVNELSAQRSGIYLAASLTFVLNSACFMSTSGGLFR